jgi:hypothetical protein
VKEIMVEEKDYNKRRQDKCNMKRRKAPSRYHASESFMDIYNV